MSFPNYPNPARRARILEAQQLRMQGLTMRQIARRMQCSVSTVHSYLRDFELFRTDLIQELAADQIVTHLIQFSDLDDPHHEQRRADLHELRLLLSAIPQIHRDESDRSAELLQGGVAVDRYGARYPKADRLHPPTPEETEQMQQPTTTEDPDPDQPLAFIPETGPDQTSQPAPANPQERTNALDPLSPPSEGGDAAGRGGLRPTPDQIGIPINRTQPNRTEHHRTAIRPKPSPGRHFRRSRPQITPSRTATGPRPGRTTAPGRPPTQKLAQGLPRTQPQPPPAPTSPPPHRKTRRPPRPGRPGNHPLTPSPL